MFTQRFKLYAAKPDACPIVRLADSNAGPGYEMIGTVSLVLRNYQVMAGRDLLSSLDEKTWRQLNAQACEIGGDAVGFGASTQSSADFAVFRRIALPAATPTAALY